MKKLFLLPLFLFGADFSNCYKKFYNIKYFQITPTLAITFSPIKNFISYDEFNKMYVYKHKGKPIKFLNNFYLGWEMASIKNNEIYVSNFAKRGFLKNFLAGVVKSNSIISDEFCRAVGVGGDGFFLDKKTILHFIKHKYYGDLPIEFDENFRVLRFDPFLVKGIKKGDKLIKINSYPANMKNFRKYVVFNKIGREVLLTFSNKTIKVKIIKKLSFKNYLKHYGIIVNKDLKVVKLPKWIYKKYFVKKGAKIEKVNGKRVFSVEEINSYLTGKNDTITFNDNGIYIKVNLNGRVY